VVADQLYPDEESDFMDVGRAKQSRTRRYDHKEVSPVECYTLMLIMLITVIARSSEIKRG
jgi:hypothetical protein